MAFLFDKVPVLITGGPIEQFVRHCKSTNYYNMLYLSFVDFLLKRLKFNISDSRDTIAAQRVSAIWGRRKRNIMGAIAQWYGGSPRHTIGAPSALMGRHLPPYERGKKML